MRQNEFLRRSATPGCHRCPNKTRASPIKSQFPPRYSPIRTRSSFQRLQYRNIWLRPNSRRRSYTREECNTRVSGKKALGQWRQAGSPTAHTETEAALWDLQSADSLWTCRDLLHRLVPPFWQHGGFSDCLGKSCTNHSQSQKWVDIRIKCPPAFDWMSCYNHHDGGVLLI